MLRKLLTPKWIITTLLVIAAVAVMARLGVWQLDRLAERRAFNARVEAQINQPALDLNAALASGSPNEDEWNAMQYRKITARGQYLPQEQIVVRNAVWQGQPGYRLLTPLQIEGTPYVILVDRGWIPLKNNQPETWAEFNQPGTVTVLAQLEQAQNRRRFGVPDPTLSPGQTRLDAWNAINLERIKGQVSGQLLPVYAEVLPDAASAETMPYPQPAQPDLSEGSHAGYAMQWFAFAAILALGYPYFVYKQLTSEKQNQPIHSLAGKRL